MPPRVVEKSPAVTEEKPVRPVVYPCVQLVVCGTPEQTGVALELVRQLKTQVQGSYVAFEEPLDAPAMMALLGWETEQEGGEKFGEDYALQDRYGRKVRLKNNPHNRPLSMSNIESLVQNVLQKRYELNGETLIVGEYGNVLNGQHTGIAVVLADQDRQLARDKETGKLLWEDKWPTDGPPVSVSKIVVYGIKETDNVVNTIDTAKPRSLADVLYRSPYFSDLPARNKNTGVDRYYASKSTDAAIRYLWVRTGLYMSNTSKTRTNSEAVAWLEGHGGDESKLLAAVRFLLKENRGKGKEGEEGYVPEGRISAEISLGQAAAFLYLMACSNTTDTKVNDYYGADDRTSAPLTFGLWGKAKAFWEAFGKEDGPLAALTKVFANMTGDEKASKGAERRYMLAKAWLLFKNDQPIDGKGLKVRYKDVSGGTGIKRLDWEPTFGGIDLGTAKVEFERQVTNLPPTEVAPDDTNGEDEGGSEPTPDRINETVSEGEQSADPTPDSTSGETGSEGPPTTPAEGVTSKELVISRVKVADPRVTDVFLKGAGGKSWVAWGAFQCAALSKFTRKKPAMHPLGIECLAFPAGDIDALCDKLTDDGRTVALVEEVIASGEGEESWLVEKLYRPGTGKKKSK